MYAVTSDELQSIPLFAVLTPTELELLAPWLEAEEVETGRRLTHQGASGYAFSILRSGGADVMVDGVVVRTLGPGDYFGELSMLDDGRQTATVVTTEPTRLLTMLGTRFRELQLDYPEVAAGIERTARSRREPQRPD